MENATKALLIAAAVLVVILVISLALVIYTKSAESVNNAGDLSEYEIHQFNEKFTKYQGENVSGSDVNAMVQTVVNHNNAEAREGGSNFVSVTGAVTVAGSAITAMPTKLNAGNRYSVAITLDADGLVTTITVTAVAAGNPS